MKSEILSNFERGFIMAFFKNSIQRTKIPLLDKKKFSPYNKLFNPEFP